MNLGKKVLHRSTSALLLIDEVAWVIRNAEVGCGEKPYRIPKQTVSDLEVPIAPNGTPAHYVPLNQLAPESMDAVYQDLLT